MRRWVSIGFSRFAEIPYECRFAGICGFVLRGQWEVTYGGREKRGSVVMAEIAGRAFAHW